jgi:hypothetical protein
MDARGESRRDLFDQIAQQRAILRPEEDVLPMVTAQRDVVHRAGHVQAKWSRHPCLEWR